MIITTEQEIFGAAQDIEMILRSDRVYEAVYLKESSEVIEWTKYFTNRANISSIFFEIRKRISDRNFFHAEIVGTFWHHFSALAPQVMSIGAGKVDSNLMRHYIIKVIYEELGTKDYRNIHPDIFLDTLEKIGVKDETREKLVKQYISKLGFSYLLQVMNDAKTNAEVLGILLGLEIDANENIQTIFDSLCFNDEIESLLKSTLFFRIHRVAEDEHIRLNVANFLRFCTTNKEKADFITGFDSAVKFWSIYWQGMTEIIDREAMS